MIQRILKYKEYEISFVYITINRNFNDAIINEYFDYNEIESLDQYKLQKRKCEFIYSRIASKIAISNFIGIDDYKRIHILKGCLNQPIVKIDNYFDNIEISLSHNNNSVVAISFKEDFPCGIDIEEIKEKNTKIIYEVLTNNEKNLIDEYSKEKKEIYTTNIWTAKEAVSKALKLGFSSGFEILEVENIDFDSEFINGRYKTLKQYKYISKIINNNICTIAYPKVNESNEAVIVKSID